MAANVSSPRPAIRALNVVSPSEIRLTEMSWAVALHAAVAQGRASMLIQSINRPEVSPHSEPDAKDLLYSEALLRLDMLPCEPKLSPSELIPSLERSGLITELDFWVLSAVLAALEGNPELILGCNISSSSVSIKSGWWDLISGRLRNDPSIATRLTLEITETAPLPDFDAAIALIAQLKALNCSIAIDDFGIGHTRLDFVRQIEPEIIKISGTLVQSAVHSKKAANELRHMVELAGALAENVVVEGISGFAEKDAACSAGAKWLQGFAISAPKVPLSPITLKPVSRVGPRISD